MDLLEYLDYDKFRKKVVAASNAVNKAKRSVTSAADRLPELKEKLKQPAAWFVK